MPSYTVISAIAIITAGLISYLYTLNFVRVTEGTYPPQGAFVDVEGIRLHYLKTGSGPPLVALHGASSSLRDFPDDLIDELSNEFTVYLFDRPGHGFSERPAENGHSPARQAELIHGALTSLGVRPSILLSHSWSGALVTAFALKFPQDVGGLVLLSGATHPWNSPSAWYNRMVRLPVIGTVVLNTVVVPLGQVLVPNGIAKNFNPNPALPNYAEMVGTALLLRPSTFRANADDSVMLKEFVREQSKRYGELKLPVIIITGDQDLTVSPEIHSVPLHETLENSELVILEGVGHMPHYVAQETVVDAVNRLAARLELL
jgi:pimeloyl-ACP methyl ester carboxylesterase